jgi:hypothetical protein
MEHLRYDFHMLFAILGVITQITHFFLTTLQKNDGNGGHGIMAGCRH